MNKTLVFYNEAFGKIRVVDADGELWLIGKDVALAAGYANPYKAIADYVSEEDKGKMRCDSLSGAQNMIVINETGLHNLISASALSNANELEHWVISEVLPSAHQREIDDIEELINNPDSLIRILTELKKEREKCEALRAENLVQKQAIADFQPSRQYIDTILSTPKDMTTEQIAADYGINTHELNAILYRKGVQINLNGQCVLCQKYTGKGYTSFEIVDTMCPDGTPDIKVKLTWTPKGRLFVHDILKGCGIQAVMDKDCA